MKILISTDLASFREVALESPFVHFCEPSELETLFYGSDAFDIWICEGKEYDQSLLYQWMRRTNAQRLFIFVKNATHVSHLHQHIKDSRVNVSLWPQCPDSRISTFEYVLREAELAFAEAQTKTEFPQDEAIGLDQQGEQHVLLVGAGILNLITAHYLLQGGFRVKIVDAGPDPRSKPHWTRMGTTHSGGDARMFTYTEADNYNESASELYTNMQCIFRKTVRAGGWSVKSPSRFTPAENEWISSFENVPGWMARAFKDDIFAVNREGGKLWAALKTDAPELFQDVGLHEDIIRMYAEDHAWDAALDLSRRLGIVLEAPDLDEFLQRYPGFHSAAQTDHLAGAFKVQGFTVNVHKFVFKLIGSIIEAHGEIVWDCPISHVSRNASGAVTSMQTQAGDELKADHYVLSPGVTGQTLLDGTASQHLIQGVLGVWLQIPNLEPRLEHSIKIHRRGHMVEDINVTVAKEPTTGEDILILGGGYGYVGHDRPAHNDPELHALFEELSEVARIYFPQAHAAARNAGTMWPNDQRKFCVRPFTPTGLGVFERVPTMTGGSMIITGGNNTGGFAQAPAIARAVCRALEGEHDPIHVLFNPCRGWSGHTYLHEGQKSAETPQVSPIAQPTLTHRRKDARSPLKLLLLCSDGPQHRYLRYRFSQTFPHHHCIIETNTGQQNQLVKKGRQTEAWYMRYHSLRRYATGYEEQRKAYFNALVPTDYEPRSADMEVETLNCREVWQKVEQWQPEITIVSGTKYIGKKLNERGGLMINLHTGHLPEYKGNHCIFFALYDEAVDKVAATLHQLTPTLDGGAILDRVYPTISPNDSEDMLYTKCLHLAIDRALERAEQFSLGQSIEFLPQENKGETYRHCDRTPSKEVALWWKMMMRKLRLEDGEKGERILSDSVGDDCEKETRIWS